MVVISLRDPGAREDITDPFYLRCLLELYCRNPPDWHSLLYAIEGLVPIPFVDHMGRRLTLAECQRATFWFLYFVSVVPNIRTLFIQHIGRVM
jgi:hypothetical protein